MSPSLESSRSRVLNRYGPVVARLRWVPLGSGGGFSGARVWRGDDATGSPVLALKCWPESTTGEQLARVHGWMGQAAHLPFVPGVLRTTDHSTFTIESGRVWDVCRWMPGESGNACTITRLANACAAIAKLHQCWKSESRRDVCPGVLSRLRLLDEFRVSFANGQTPLPPIHAVLDPLLKRAWEVASRVALADVLALRRWANTPVAVQPCVRDLRAEHVRFGGEDVTGIIDYGAMAFDSPAVDLARFLGEFAGDDDTAFTAGIAAYRSAGGTLDVPDEFVRLLDRTGVICSLIGWVRRFFVVHQTHEHPCAVASRLIQLLSRAEKIFVP